jgi:hypothetical protein
MLISLDWFKGNFTGNPSIFKGKSMVSRCSLQSSDNLEGITIRITIRCQVIAAPSVRSSGDGQACSRSCGGGLYEMRRNVIAQAGLGGPW